MLGYLSADIICSETRTVFFEEQIMFKDKYPSIFSLQMEAIVFTILKYILNNGAQFRRPFLKIIEQLCKILITIKQTGPFSSLKGTI